ncbi:MAG TPA: GntR family transcriptional regulator [Anaerolineae bacterium]|nr:GntR family transcriptional regulator [Anaerolineae bacterium]
MTELTYAPRYREIEQALRARISRLRPGQRLPSDADLCAEFGVSRMTARHAMAQLAEEGLVRRDPGRGTFVAEPPTHRRANFLMTFSHEMRRQGRRPSSRIVERVVRPPTDGERSELRVAHGADVVDLRRVRLADGRPVAVERAVLASRCIGSVLAADLETGSLHEALIRDGMVPSRGKSSIRAEAATRDDAVLLGVATGEPMLVERRLIFDQRGRPIERTESRYAADRYGLNVGFSVEDSGAVTISPDA